MGALPCPAGRPRGPRPPPAGNFIPFAGWWGPRPPRGPRRPPTPALLNNPPPPAPPFPPARALDRNRRLPRQQEAADCDQHERGQRGRAEDPDQRCVLLPDVRPLGDRDRDVRRAGPSSETLGMQTQLMSADRVVLHVDAAAGA